MDIRLHAADACKADKHHRREQYAGEKPCAQAELIRGDRGKAGGEARDLKHPIGEKARQPRAERAADGRGQHKARSFDS